MIRVILVKGVLCWAKSDVTASQDEVGWSEEKYLCLSYISDYLKPNSMERALHTHIFQTVPVGGKYLQNIIVLLLPQEMRSFSHKEDLRSCVRYLHKPGDFIFPEQKTNKPGVCRHSGLFSSIYLGLLLQDLLADLLVFLHKFFLSFTLCFL